MVAEGEHVVKLPIEDVAKEYREGATLRELADRYDASHETIRQRLLDAGVELRTVGHPKKTGPIDQMVADRKAGDSWADIGERYDMSPMTAQRRVEEALDTNP